ncbi:glucokinase [Roseovarius sp. C7]|uniref:glucokinase n=1 Tax=Roseovarius sp. C7 TaxID=3398643 RepID=UPI0039F68A7D
MLLGQVLGNFATIHLPMGGVYLIGGLARAVLPHLDTHALRAAFTHKGPYRAILEDIPLTLITDDDAALRGCTRRLQQG